MATIGNALGTALSLMARKAAAFDFIDQRGLRIKCFRKEPGKPNSGYWMHNPETGFDQPGLFPTLLEAVESYMKEGEVN